MDSYIEFQNHLWMVCAMSVEEERNLVKGI